MAKVTGKLLVYNDETHKTILSWVTLRVSLKVWSKKVEMGWI